MCVPLSEVPSNTMGVGEERNYFLFHEREPNIPLEVVITRLPPPLYSGTRFQLRK